MKTRKTRTPVDLLDAIRYFADPDICRQFLVEARWPNGVTCPRKGCGSMQAWFINARGGIWRCKGCGKQFSVKVGTIFEDSPLGLDKWLPAVWLLTAATKGVSSHRLAHALSITQKTAWFMEHRIRLALRNGNGFDKPMTGEIEADTTGIGGKEKNKHAHKRLHRGTGNAGKAIVFGLLARHGEVRAKSVPNEQADTLQPVIRQNVATGEVLYTDQAAGFRGLQRDYAHDVINHAEEFVRGRVHTNGIENFWSNFKRRIYGTHHFVMPWHLDRYLDDATFRFNTRKESDGARFAEACARTDGRRLTWKQLTGKEETSAPF